MPNTATPQYLNLVKLNPLQYLMQQLAGQGYYLDDDGLINMEKRRFWNPPWVYIKHAPWQQCHLWHKIFFNIIHKQTKVPIGCLSCWKVVVKPQTVVQLFALHKLQVNLNLWSKCGTEIDRQNTHDKYGGFFYNFGFEPGRECYKVVRQAVSNWPGLGPDIPVILKRGCTEFEQHCGPSNKWEETITQEQVELEDLMTQYIRGDIGLFSQGENEIASVQQNWIQDAARVGDMTYLELTGGTPRFPKLVTYHEDLDAEYKNKTGLPERLKVNMIVPPPARKISFILRKTTVDTPNLEQKKKKKK